MEKYHTLELVGEGSFGKVYKGRRRHCGQVVALKIIPTVGRSSSDLTSLRQEIDILRTLKHENIVLMLDYFETPDGLCVVTEFAQGELFAVLEDDKTLPEVEIRSIARQLTHALHYLHSNRVIHRDMKPQNVLVGANSRVMLCDFGFARAMSQQTTVLTSIKGTPLYMSPELVQELPYDHKSDLWSLGVILYELFVGQPPFYTNNIYSLINMILKDPVVYLPSMSPEFTSFLKGLLTKDPKRRSGWPDLLQHPFINAPCTRRLTQRVAPHALNLRHLNPTEFLSVLPPVPPERNESMIVNLIDEKRQEALELVDNAKSGRVVRSAQVASASDRLKACHNVPEATESPRLEFEGQQVSHMKGQVSSAGFQNQHQETTPTRHQAPQRHTGTQQQRQGRSPHSVASTRPPQQASDVKLRQGTQSQRQQNQGAPQQRPRQRTDVMRKPALPSAARGKAQAGKDGSKFSLAACGDPHVAARFHSNQSPAQLEREPVISGSDGQKPSPPTISRAPAQAARGGDDDKLLMRVEPESSIARMADEGCDFSRPFATQTQRTSSTTTWCSPPRLEQWSQPPAITPGQLGRPHHEIAGPQQELTPANREQPTPWTAAPDLTPCCAEMVNTCHRTSPDRPNSWQLSPSGLGTCHLNTPASGTCDASSGRAMPRFDGTGIGKLVLPETPQSVSHLSDPRVYAREHKSIRTGADGHESSALCTTPSEERAWTETEGVFSTKGEENVSQPRVVESICRDGGPQAARAELSRGGQTELGRHELHAQCTRLQKILAYLGGNPDGGWEELRLVCRNTEAPQSLFVPDMATLLVHELRAVLDQTERHSSAPTIPVCAHEANGRVMAAPQVASRAQAALGVLCELLLLSPNLHRVHEWDAGWKSFPSLLGSLMHELLACPGAFGFSTTVVLIREILRALESPLRALIAASGDQEPFDPVNSATPSRSPASVNAISRATPSTFSLPIAWADELVTVLIPKLPKLLAQLELQLATLRCVHALFAAVPKLSSQSADSDGIVSMRFQHMHLMETLQLQPAAIHSLCDTLGQRHEHYTVAILAALVHVPPIEKTDHKVVQNAEQASLMHTSLGGTDLADAYALCAAGHSLSSHVGQQLLAWRSRITHWVNQSPLPALRLLLHCSRAEPALATALAADKHLLQAVWERVHHRKELAPLTSSLPALMLIAALLSQGCLNPTSLTIEATLPHLANLTSLLEIPNAMDIGLGPLEPSATALASAAAACIGELLRSDTTAPRMMDLLINGTGSDSASSSHREAARSEDWVLQSVLSWLAALRSQEATSAVESVLRDAEGECFAVGITKPADGFANMLHRFLLRLPMKHTINRSLASASFWDTIITTLGGNAHRVHQPLLSATGTLSMVKVVCDALAKHSHASATLLDHHAISVICNLLHSEKLQTLRELPPSRGGGPKAASSLVNAVSLILHIPFSSRGEQNTHTLVRLQQAMYSKQVLYALQQALSIIAPEEGEVAVGLMSRLVLGSKHFSQQFVQVGGLRSSVLREILGESRGAATLTEGLLILCQLARTNGPEQAGYAELRSYEFCERLPPLLRHKDAAVRSKACNLIGNLCRHSDVFYDYMLKLGILPLLVQCCADQDGATRKFACFAIGNAGFHSSSLYTHFLPSIPLLVQNLSDPDRKTRANAAGALGNLGRNGSRLCDALNAAGAPAALFDVVCEPLQSDSSAYDLIPARTALFSLGNLAAHSRCAEAIRSLEVHRGLESLKQLGDDLLTKYSGRLLQKLDQARGLLHSEKLTPMPHRSVARQSNVAES